MKTSENVDQIATALAKAQGAMDSAKKDSFNPHFKSKYADLAACLDAIREPFAANGLSVVQLPFTDAEGKLFLSTRLMHASGQWIEATYSMPPTKNDCQGMMAAITYMRRGSLVGFGIAVEDDDGNAAARPAPAPAMAPLEDPRSKAIKWSKDAAAEIRTMKTDDALHEWEKKNSASMVKLRSVDEALHRNVLDVWAEQNEKVSSKVAAE